MIIAMDGLDGAGKSTQSARLRDWLAATGRPCHLISKWGLCGDPRHPETRFLRGTDRAEIRRCVAEMPDGARLMFLMWMYAEATAAAARLDARGDLVVLDGHWMKHAAAELALGIDPAVVAGVTAGMPQADAVLYLDIDPEEALARKLGRLTPYESGLDPDCRPERFLAQQKKMREYLLEWGDRSGWTRVDAGRGTAEVQSDIRAAIAELLPAPEGTAADA